MANVAPPEVEQEIVALDGVATAYVVAVPDDTLGEAVGAAIVAEDGRTLDATELTRALRDRLSSFKVPRIVALCTNEEIPLTPTNKVDKRALAALIADRGVWPAR